MKKYILSIGAIIFIIASCGNNQDNQAQSNFVVEANGTLNQNKLSDTIPFVESDKIDVKGKDYSLKAVKTDKGIRLNYKLKDKEHEMYFRYNEYSDIVFPDTSIGLIQSKSVYTKVKFYLFNNILVLPLIGVNNTLSTYIINLDKEEVIADDIRTSYSLLWLNKNDGNFIISQTPVVMDTIYQYEMNKYDINDTSIKLIDKKKISLSMDIKDDHNAQFNVVKKMLIK